MLNLPVAEIGQRCERGLHIAPWMGEHGEIILLAFTASRRLAAPPLEIPIGANSLEMAEQLQAVLDAADPPYLKLI